MADRNDEATDLEATFRRLLDSELKVRLAHLFQENPGLVETLEGLARRMGANQEQLAAAIEDHVAIGLLKRLHAGAMTVFTLDRSRRRDFERLIMVATQERLWEETT